MNFPNKMTQKEFMISLAERARQSNLDKIFNFCYKTLGPTATTQKMQTCYQLYNATMALSQKSFSLYLKNRNFQKISPTNN